MRSQPAPSVGSDDVERIVSRDFPDEPARVLDLLGEYGTEERHTDVDRVRLAALKLAAGDMNRLRAQYCEWLRR